MQPPPQFPLSRIPPLSPPHPTLTTHARALTPPLSLSTHIIIEQFLGISTVYHRVGGGAPRVGSHTHARARARAHTHTCIQSHHAQTSNPPHTCARARARVSMSFFPHSLTRLLARSLHYLLPQSHMYTHTQREKIGVRIKYQRMVW